MENETTGADAQPQRNGKITTAHHHPCPQGKGVCVST